MNNDIYEVSRTISERVSRYKNLVYVQSPGVKEPSPMLAALGELITLAHSIKWHEISSISVFNADIVDPIKSIPMADQMLAKLSVDVNTLVGDEYALICDRFNKAICICGSQDSDVLYGNNRRTNPKTVDIILANNRWIVTLFLLQYVDL